MKKIMILTQEEVGRYKRDRDIGNVSNFPPKELRIADIVLAKAEHNEDYFYIIKGKDTQNGYFIHHINVGDFCTGKSVRLYDIDETYRNEQHGWDVEEKELYAQMDEMLERIQNDKKPINALHRMEIDD